MRNRIRVVTFVVVGALGAVACGEDDVVAPPPVVDAPDVLVVTLDLEAGAGVEAERVAEVEATVDVVRRRLAALGVEGEVGWDDESIEVLVPDGDEELIRAAMEPVGELQFRPVLELLDPTTARATVIDGAVPDPSAEVVLAADTGELYRLGPSALGAEAIEGTVVGQGAAGYWTIDPTFAEGPSGIDAFNAIAATCYEAATACPAQSPDGRGQLAIVVDDVVLSAPAIQTPAFERDEIQISGDFSEAGARALAVSMDAGVAPVRWTVRD